MRGNHAATASCFFGSLPHHIHIWQRRYYTRERRRGNKNFKWWTLHFYTRLGIATLHFYTWKRILHSSSLFNWIWPPEVGGVGGGEVTLRNIYSPGRQTWVTLESRRCALPCRPPLIITVTSWSGQFAILNDAWCSKSNVNLEWGDPAARYQSRCWLHTKSSTSQPPPPFSPQSSRTFSMHN